AQAEFTRVGAESRWHRIPHSAFRIYASLIVVLSFASILHADVVTVAQGPDGRQRLRREGEVMDYTGQHVVLRLPSGRQVEIPTKDVVAVDAQYAPEHRQGDLALAAGRYEEALAHYRSVQNEQRRWVRRLLGSKVARALHGLGRNAEAGKMFLAVFGDDPGTPYLDAIPLAWTAGDKVDAATAADWLAQGNNSAAMLLGASYSIGGEQQGSALRALEALTRDADERIAALAEAQLFRAKLAAASEDQLRRFAAQVDQMPDSIKAGPWYVLGRGYAQQGRHVEGAEALMRVPILFSEQGNLAAESLLASGKLLAAHAEEAEDQQELLRTASDLYQEVLIHYADSTAAGEAKQRLAEVRRQLARPSKQRN
ncbi:MAG: hypothetical protein WEA31_06915, partial [Pirellulales bacterium]